MAAEYAGQIREPDCARFLAVTDEAYLEYFDPAEGRDLVLDEFLKLIVFHPLREEILQWID
jgi:hypothetical protein